MTDQEAAELVRRGCTPARVQEAISEGALMQLSWSTMTVPGKILDLSRRWPIVNNRGRYA